MTQKRGSLWVLLFSLGFGFQAHSADQLSVFVDEAKPANRFEKHLPAFSFAKEKFVFKPNEETEEVKEFWVVKDSGKYVAVLDEASIQLDMITFDPSQVVDKPPFQNIYTWARLLGTRITTNVWYGDMRPNGEMKTEFSGGGSTLTLTTTQTWSGEKKARAKYVMTLRCDPVLGYVWDAATDLETSKGLNDKGQPETIEFFNWQVRTTDMTQRNNQRWPCAWTHDCTVFYRADDKLVGFHMNPEANDHGRFKRTEVKNGGFVAMLPDVSGWGVALAHVDKGSASCNNNTCNMWADSHNMLKLPAQPDADGMYRAKATWRFQAIPPEVTQSILLKTELDTLGYTKKN